MERRIHNRTKHFINGVPAVWVAEEHGISKNLFTSRLKSGWSVLKACTYKPMSTKELSNKLGISVNKINNLLRLRYYTRKQLEDMANGKIQNI